MTVGAVLDATGAGRDLVAGDVVIGVGWGGTATKAIRAGSNRSRGAISVTASATTPAQATATIVITFPEPYDEIPYVVLARDVGDEGGSGAGASTRGYVKAVTKTALTIQSDTLPVAGQITGVSYIVVS